MANELSISSKPRRWSRTGPPFLPRSPIPQPPVLWVSFVSTVLETFHPQYHFVAIILERLWTLTRLVYCVNQTQNSHPQRIRKSQYCASTEVLLCCCVFRVSYRYENVENGLHVSITQPVFRISCAPQNKFMCHDGIVTQKMISSSQVSSEENERNPY